MAKDEKDQKNPKNPRYSAEDIYVLEGLDPVRKRPGMYIGSTGADGLHHLVWEIFDNSRDEAMGGFATEIEVALLPANVVRVADDGRGIPVDIHPKTKVSALETAMTTLHAGGKFGGESYKVSGGLHGVGASVVNALSTWLKAEIHKDGGKHIQEYDRGKPRARVKKVAPSKAHGTIITFTPDHQIFSAIEFDFEKIKDHHRQQAYLVKGLKVRIIDARQYEGKIDTDVFYLDSLKLPVPSHSFYFEGGIRSLIKYLNEEEEPIHSSIFYVEKTYEKVVVEAALQYITEIGGREMSFANNILTGEGGTHLTGFRSALTRVLNDYARKNGFLKESDDNLSGEDVREGLTAVISVKISEPQFEGQTKAKLGSQEGRTATEAVVGEALTDFFEENPQDARKIIEKCVLAQKARKAAKAARETVLRKGVLEGLALPGKLADCSSRKAEESELYIVEGDSAGGCWDGDTKVALVDGRNLSFKELAVEDQLGKKNFCYTVRDDGHIGIAPILSPRITKRQADVVEVTLDTGERLICTPDHLFRLVDGVYIPANQLTSLHSLAPLYRQISERKGARTLDGYEMVFDLKSKEWMYTHVLADMYNLRNKVYAASQGKHRHHIDFNKRNNNPINIQRIPYEQHMNVHYAHLERTLHRPDVKTKSAEAKRTDEFRKKARGKSLEKRELFSSNAKKQWQNEEYKNYMIGKFLEFYNSNTEYREKNNQLINEAQKRYWASGANRNKQAERVKKYFENHPEKREWLSDAAKEQWADSKLRMWRSEKTKEQWTQEFRAKRKEAYNKTYLAKGLAVLRGIYERCGAIDDVAYNKKREQLSDKSVIKLSTLTDRFFGGDKEKLREAVLNYNHKVAKVVPLREKIDVYDLEVPGTHNFALASGVFVHNSAKQGRDRRFQAILPLRGKILNIERARLDKVLSSSEIRALIIALGTAIADEFDISKLRYHRIIIMTDADVDGSHIRTLLLTLFYRYFPSLIDNGYIYIAQPPLYRIQSGKKASYAYTDAQKEKIISEWKKEKQEKVEEKSKKPKKPEEGEATEEAAEGEEKIKGVSIQRYKGLGEMNPEQLWSTTMSPESRVMKRVVVADAQEADKMFDILMGSDVLPRKRFIQTHAKNVKNLDI